VSGDVLPTILGLLLVATAAVFALLPFVRGSQASSDSTSEPLLASLATDRGQLYRQVLELEFDYQVGKLSEADYRELSSSLLAQAGELLRVERGSLSELDEEIEREIAAARAAFAAARGVRAARKTRSRRSKKTAEPVP
jgi:hypothetical protein